MRKAFVSEIYSSIQGEGPFTGESHIFLRFAGCPLRCTYCDTPDSLVAKGHRLMSTQQVLGSIEKLSRESRARTVSLTGGEPLVYYRFLGHLLPQLKKRRYKIYLETAGVHAKSLATIVENCDVISMDMKLPSATGKKFWKEHREFLRTGKGKIFVKIVLERKTRLSEIKKAVSVLEKSPSILLVIQPATPMPPLTQAPTADQISMVYDHASKRLPQVLVMPQQQKAWGVR